MTSGPASVGATLVKDAGAQAIFTSDAGKIAKYTEHLPSDSSKVNGTKGPGENVRPALVPKEFYWDQMVTILVSAILGLSLLDIFAEYFRGSGLQCYTPTPDSLEISPDGFTRDRAGFVNSYCYRSLPRGEYFTVFILAHGLAIIAPHYLWSSLYGGKFGHFFDLVKDLNRLRNPNTGHYDASNFEIVRKLEEEYYRGMIFVTYGVKLLLQFFFSLASFLVVALYFDYKSFSRSFCCPNDCEAANETLPPDWPLETNLRCVYSSLQYLLVLRYVDIALVGVTILVLLYGLLWCVFRHSSELGYKAVAKFVINSCLLAENYVPKSWLRQPFSPSIKNDIDFLLLRLHRTDAGHGKVFKEIQVQKEINHLNKQRHELLQMFLVADDDNRSGEFF